MKLLKENAKGKTYQTDSFKILYRNKGSISGDNSENVEEEMYLVSGSAKISVEETTQTHEAPYRFKIPARTYHKIKSLTDTIIIMFEK